jgi:hypothetical protein
MKRLINLLTVVVICVAVIPVRAQGPAPYVIRSTRPISTQLRERLDDWLLNSPPSAAPYYIVTNTSMIGDVTRVSLVGVDLESPDADWNFEDGDHTVWLGSVTVSADGVVTYDDPVTGASKMAAPSMANGGGSYLSFPFAAGTTALYGPRGVHAAGYGTTGMRAIDIVSGDDMGASAAPPYATAADAGTVDYVCDDGTSVAVRTHNSSTGDYFIYAHMINNANLVEGHTFSAGEVIGSLVYGTFDDDCGWADQQAKHYHLHWGFAPASGKFQVGGCVLTVSTQAWACGQDQIKVGGYLTGGGGFVGNGDDTNTGGGSVVTDPTFWDYFLIGVLNLIERIFVKNLPAHQPLPYTYMLYNFVSLTLRLVWVFAASNINLKWLGITIGVGLTVKAIFGIIWLVAAVIRTFKILPGA